LEEQFYVSISSNHATEQCSTDTVFQFLAFFGLDGFGWSDVWDNWSDHWYNHTSIDITCFEITCRKRRGAGGLWVQETSWSGTIHVDFVFITSVIFDSKCLLGINADSESFSLIWIVVTNKIDVNYDSHRLSSSVFSFLDMNRLSIVCLVIFVSIFWFRVSSWITRRISAAENTIVNNR